MCVPLTTAWIVSDPDPNGTTSGGDRGVHSIPIELDRYEVRYLGGDTDIPIDTSI
jgi:hypothetical protein